MWKKEKKYLPRIKYLFNARSKTEKNIFLGAKQCRSVKNCEKIILIIFSWIAIEFRFLKTMTQNPFQPWKQSFNSSNQFYRKNDGDIISSYNSRMTKNNNNNACSDAGSSATNLSVLSYAFDMNASDGTQSYPQTTPAPMTTSSSSNSVSDSDPPPQSLTPQLHHQQQHQLNSIPLSQSKASQNASSSKFSIFSQLLNLNKIQSFDNLLMNATLDDDDLSTDKRHGIRKLMEQAIRYATTYTYIYSSLSIQ